MKYFLIIATCLFISTHGFSQDGLSFEPTASSFENEELKLNYPRRRRHFNRKYRWRGTMLGSFGFAIGPETLFAPKGSILARIAYSDKIGRSNREFTLFGLHGGVEFSMFGLFAIWGSAGLNAGISIGPVTLDGSLTFWGIGLNKSHFGTTTYNPKIGLQIIDYVWLKAGYSYFLRGENPFPNWMKVGENSMNFEVLLVAPL